MLCQDSRGLSPAHIDKNFNFHHYKHNNAGLDHGDVDFHRHPA